MTAARRRQAALLVALACCGLAACAGAPGPTPAPSASAVVVPAPPPSTLSRPADLRRAVEDRLDRGSVELSTVTSVVISVDGETRLELYRGGTGPRTWTHVWSVTKSVVSALVGIALEEGRIRSLDATLPELLPDHAAQMSAVQRTITLRHLLTMSSGTASDVRALPDGRVETILAAPAASAPGERFEYSDPGSQLVSAVLEEAVGTSTLEYARSRLFEPLGVPTRPAFTREWAWPRIDVGPRANPAFSAAGFAWATTEDGTTNGCCTLRLRPVDLQALGRLYLDEGRAGGRQVVPAAWVRQSVAPSATSSDYGLLWWRELIGTHQAFAAEGRGGQLVAVIPDTRTVVTVTSLPVPGMELVPDDLVALLSDVLG